MPTPKNQNLIAQKRAEIKSFIKQKEWVKAHKICLEILRYDPDNMRVIRMKNKIERKVKKLNALAIKKDLKALDPLWKEGKYKEVLEHLKELQPFAGQYPRLISVIAEAQEAYRKQILQEERTYEQDSIKRVAQLRREKKYREALEITTHLLSAKLQEQSLQTLRTVLQKEWANDELQKNKELLQQGTPKQKLDFLQKLQAIDPSSSKVKLQIMAATAQYQRAQSKEQKGNVREVFQKINSLLKAKKYDEALNGAENLIKIAPKNPKAQKVLARVQRKVQKATQKEVVQQMKKAHRNIKKVSKEERKKEYIKI